MTRWQPSSEADLLLAAETCILDESTPGLELKSSIPMTKASNKELGIDLTSLAINGGTLLIGIVDVKDRDPEDHTTALAALECADLPERIGAGIRLPSGENAKSRHRGEPWHEHQASSGQKSHGARSPVHAKSFINNTTIAEAGRADHDIETGTPS